MIVVKVELHSAVNGKVTQLAQAIIANDGTATKHKLGNYDAMVARKGHFDFHHNTLEPQRRGRVENYPRLSYNVWRLIIRALLSAFPEEQR